MVGLGREARRPSQECIDRECASAQRRAEAAVELRAGAGVGAATPSEAAAAAGERQDPSRLDVRAAQVLPSSCLHAT